MLVVFHLPFFFSSSPFTNNFPEEEKIRLIFTSPVVLLNQPSQIESFIYWWPAIRLEAKCNIRAESAQLKLGLSLAKYAGEGDHPGYVQGMSTIPLTSTVAPMVDNFFNISLTMMPP